MAQLDQANYAAALKTPPLSDNVLVLKSFSGTEGLGEPFEFQIEALTGIFVKVPAITEIDAPIVIIKGHPWAQREIGMGPMCMPVS
jgi:hypothetical protein